MKRGRGWKKLKEMTDYIYHYDNIEITNSNNSGHHIHNHITYGCMNEDVPIKEIKDELFNTWNHYTRKNGLRTSKEGVDVCTSLYGSHSGSRSVKSIEESEGIKGTLEYWESVSWEYENEPNYTHQDKTPEEVGSEIKDLYKILGKSKRGRIESRDRNIPIPYIPTNKDIYKPEDLKKILDGYNKDKNYKHPDFTRKELKNHLKVFNKVSKGNNNFRVFYDKDKWKWIDTPELPFL